MTAAGLTRAAVWNHGVPNAARSKSDIPNIDRNISVFIIPIHSCAITLPSLF
jgi:hypothetical protein